MRTLAKAAESTRARLGAAAGGKPKAQLTWTKAVVIGLALTASMIVTLAWIPSYFTYWWAGRSQEIFDFVNRTAGREILKDPYMSVRIRDFVSMGYQTTVFAVYIVAAYLWAERRRRRLGQRGVDEVTGYLPGK